MPQRSSGVNLLHMFPKLVLLSSGVVIVEKVRRADSITGRMRGLIGRTGLPPDEALLLTPCKQVHTFGMRFPIDVVFCDDSWIVTHVVRAMQPRRVSRIEWRARYTLELPEGAAGAVSVGDRVALVQPEL